MFRNALILPPLMLLAACSSGGGEDGEGNAFTRGFDDGWNREFVASCVAEASKSGAPEDQAEPLCSCIAEELGNKLDGWTEKLNPPIDKIDAAGEKCLAEL